MSRLVQYLVVKDLDWPRGALMAQAAHAAVAVLMSFREDPAVQEYCDPVNLHLMTKIILKASDEQFEAVCGRLREASIDHYVWMEQPENIPTAIALKPALKEAVHPHLKQLKLFS